MGTKRRGNVVEEVVERLHGKARAGAVADVTTMSVYRWLEKGEIRDAASVLRLAEAAEPDDLEARWALARRLAGLE